MKLLICGGREYRNASMFWETVTAMVKAHDITHIISGGAQGADRLAEIYATEKGITLTVYRADWSSHGRAAGPIRNQQMLDEGRPDFVMAFPGDRGTADMIKRSERAGMPVIRVLG